jgi:hypothetical protein
MVMDPDSPAYSDDALGGEGPPCDHCHAGRADVRQRRTPDGEVGDLCQDCWGDAQGPWATRRDA